MTTFCIIFGVNINWLPPAICNNISAQPRSSDASDPAQHKIKALTSSMVTSVIEKLQFILTVTHGGRPQLLLLLIMWSRSRIYRVAVFATFDMSTLSHVTELSVFTWCQTHAESYIKFAFTIHDFSYQVHVHVHLGQTDKCAVHLHVHVQWYAAEKLLGQLSLIEVLVAGQLHVIYNIH